ncbi:MAG: hypothetical protein CVV27_11400 [Candidatus Melainabacteria bacterium HGW-Melainabacteria-1]|nr:MAG: hypothetical protein CVV27_11400 [Candidatus Melainabacteria bacterium HGW-Melainabacteria-1]
MLFACTAPPPPALTPDTLPPQQLIPYALRSQAFDGEQLWQLAREGEEQYLIKQNLLGQPLQKLSIQAEIPPHRNLCWGQGKLWLLDHQNTVSVLSLQGQLLATLKLDFEPGTAEQLVWSEDQLWLLQGAWLSATGATEPARFHQLDPANGRILATLKLQEAQLLPARGPGSARFSDFTHQNLAADPQSFYVARANIFAKPSNTVYRIDRRSGQASMKALDRIYTGLSSLFLWQNRLYGIELLDTSNCGEACRGKLESLPKPE